MRARSSIDSEVGAQVRVLRLRRKWSLQQLGEEAELSRQGVHRIETGLVSPPLSTLERIAGALGVTVAELVGGPRVIRSRARRSPKQVPEGS